MNRNLTKEWITLSPSSGQGNTTLKISVEANTGRNERRKHIVATTSGEAEAEALVVQNGAGEYVGIAEEKYMQSSDQTIVVRGWGNSKKLTFSVIQGGSRGADVPSDDEYDSAIHNVLPFMIIQSSYTTYKADGTPISCSNGTNISGDPGADAEYLFDVTLTYDSTHEATYSKERCRLKVVADNGAVAYCDIVRVLDSFITLNGATGMSLVFGAEEETKNVTLSSNDSWVVDVDDNIPE